MVELQSGVEVLTFSGLGHILKLNLKLNLQVDTFPKRSPKHG